MFEDTGYTSSNYADLFDAHPGLYFETGWGIL